MTPTALKSWRAKHALTQSQLATLLHVHPDTIRAWEAERQGIPGFLALALERLEQILAEAA